MQQFYAQAPHANPDQVQIAEALTALNRLIPGKLFRLQKNADGTYIFIKFDTEAEALLAANKVPHCSLCEYSMPDETNKQYYALMLGPLTQPFIELLKQLGTTHTSSATAATPARRI